MAQYSFIQSFYSLFCRNCNGFGPLKFDITNIIHLETDVNFNYFQILGTNWNTTSIWKLLCSPRGRSFASYLKSCWLGYTEFSEVWIRIKSKLLHEDISNYFKTECTCFHQRKIVKHSSWHGGCIFYFFITKTLKIYNFQQRHIRRYVISKEYMIQGLC